MDSEEAMRLTALYGTCVTCGAPMTTRMRTLENDPAPGQRTVLEEMTCSADPNFQSDQHQRGEVLLHDGVDIDL